MRRKANTLKEQGNVSRFLLAVFWVYIFLFILPLLPLQPPLIYQSAKLTNNGCRGGMTMEGV
jgi:hypothetical protein